MTLERPRNINCIYNWIVLLAEYIRFSIRMKTFGHKFKIYFPSFIYSKVTKMCFEIKNFREGVNPKKKKSLLYFESILFASKITVLHIYHFKFFLDLLQLRRHLKERKGTPQGFAGNFEQGLIWQKINFISLSIIYIPWTYCLPNGRDISPLQQQTLQELCRLCDTILHNRFNCF